MRHLTESARIVGQLSPAEDQKQRCETKTRREDDLIVEMVHHDAAVVPHLSALRRRTRDDLRPAPYSCSSVCQFGGGAPAGPGVG